MVIFEGTAAASPVEDMINSVRQALLHDNLEKLSRISMVEKVFLITNNPAPVSYTHLDVYKRQSGKRA